MRLAIEIVEDGSAWAPRKVLANLLDLSSAEETPARHVANEPKFTGARGAGAEIARRRASEPRHRGRTGDRPGDGEEACGDADAEGRGEKPNRALGAGSEPEAAFEVIFVMEKDAFVA